MSRTSMIGSTDIAGNYYKTGARKSENEADFGALLQAGGGREEQLKAARKRAGEPAASEDTNQLEENAGEPKSYREQILEKMEEMAKNIKNGTIQPKFQIGAQAFTVKEWEKLLEKFDEAEETLWEEVKAQIEEVKKLAEEEAARRAAMFGEPQPAKMTEETDVKDAAALLTDEITKCSYPTSDPKQKHWYITAYGQDGISCKEAYFDGTRWVNKDLWSFSYTEKGQYEKVMAFLKRFPQDANLRFAAHKEFWMDFLAGEIDEDDFVSFYETAKDGVPEYIYGETDSVQGGGQRHPENGEEETETKLVTKPDGSTVLQIKTKYGVTELEITQAQKFGLLLDMGRSPSAENGNLENSGLSNSDIATVI